MAIKKRTKTTTKPATKATAKPAAKPVKDLDTEARILEAARRVFIRRGSSGARVQEIAAEAGVNQALVHYYFRTKEVLAERVFLESASVLARALAPVPDPTATLEQTVERFVDGYISTVRHMPFVPGYLLAEAHQQPERLNVLVQKAIGTVPANVAKLALAHIEKQITTRVAAGTMRPMSPRQFLVNIMSLVVFPFVARPILSAAFGFDDAAFAEFLDERRRELPGFILNALRP